MSHALCVQSAADGCFGRFSVLALVNNTAAHVGEMSSLRDMALIFCPVLGSGVTEVPNQYGIAAYFFLSFVSICFMGLGVPMLGA